MYLSFSEWCTLSLFKYGVFSSVPDPYIRIRILRTYEKFSSSPSKLLVTKGCEKEEGSGTGSVTNYIGPAGKPKSNESEQIRIRNVAIFTSRFSSVSIR